MCLIVFDWRPGSSIPLRLAGNRDEFHERPSAALAHWKDAPDILGGRDLRAGGTWLAAHRQGRLAAVTNVRDPGFQPPDAGSSRGHLVRDALQSRSLSSWLQELAENGARGYAGFNLLVCDGQQLWHVHHGRQGTLIQSVDPGLHGLSNASLDTPWPKLLRSRDRLGRAPTSRAAFAEHAWALLADDAPGADTDLPDTGVGMALERRLSPPFIIGDDYGTRASTWVKWHANGDIAIGERRFGPGGRLLGEQCHQLATPALPSS